MIIRAKQSLLLAAVLGFSASAIAQTAGIDMKGTVGYVVDQRSNVVKSGAGLCWRTGYWTPAMAVAECDPELAPKAAAPEAAPKAAAPAAPSPKPAATKVTLAADALFDFNKATLREYGTKKLLKLVDDLQKVRLEVIIIVGHADRLGSDKYNQTLSEKRAATVKEFLVTNGIEPNRIYTEGKGKKQPVTKAGTCQGPKSAKVIECLQPDRRVEIEVIGTK